MCIIIQDYRPLHQNISVSKWRCGLHDVLLINGFVDFLLANSRAFLCLLSCDEALRRLHWRGLYTFIYSHFVDSEAAFVRV